MMSLKCLQSILMGISRFLVSLPTTNLFSLPHHNVVPLEGFEPSVSRFVAVRFIQLIYRGVLLFIQQKDTLYLYRKDQT